jgi:hypothetical protein
MTARDKSSGEETMSQRIEFGHALPGAEATSRIIRIILSLRGTPRLQHLEKSDGAHFA